ncbi:uncharacterized protein LOC142985886 [Anticarsia gemmatalis]|uniref:uncharacterized protein LOC142985886 n=1 Tax=Anticarsia gemmatalis TaxID=129554 RepID=UPI003F760921
MYPSAQSPCKASNNAQETLEIAAGTSVLSRIPEFWRDQPRLWFTQFEAIVAPQKQGDDYKYYTVTAKLSKEEIIQVSDIITSPPATEKYKAIKERLIGCYEESDDRQLQKLLSEMELGDQKPSHLLRKMRVLSKEKIGDDTIKLLWLRLLPPSVTTVLAVTKNMDVNKMSEIADKILVNSKLTEVSAENRNKTNDDTMTCILAQLANMRVELNAIQQGHKDYRRSGQDYYNRQHYPLRKQTQEIRETNPSTDYGGTLCYPPVQPPHYYRPKKWY